MPGRAENPILKRVRERQPEIAELLAAGRGTNCNDWPLLFDWAVGVVEPLRRHPGPEHLFSFAMFDLIHDALWTRCRSCSESDCLRCHPLYMVTDRQLRSERLRAEKSSAAIVRGLEVLADARR